MKLYKKSYLLLISIFMLAFFTACNKDAVAPELNVVATPSTVNVGEQVVFEIVGDAETFVIFTGDPGNNYENSYLAIADGQDVDLESVQLTSDSLNNLLPWLQTQIDNYNATAQDPLVYDDIVAGLNAIVGQNYDYRETAKYEITSDLMPPLPNVANYLVDNYFQDNSTLLAPDGGYDTGVSLDKYNLGYVYTYNATGQYTATIVATNVSTKNYSGSGYKDNRTASADEYNFNRTIKQVTITVQ